jgi:uncharacterized coiled-coil protein SlyX
MSENEHVAAIRSCLNRMRDRNRSWDDKLNGATAIEHHLDALAAQLAEERARADTLSAKADALEQRVRHLECTPRISYSSGTRPGGDLHDDTQHHD